MPVVEARLYHVEQQVEQLAQQVKLLKQLITTEVADLRKVTEQQMAEVKQAMMYQDRLYQERVGKMETRIQQLSEFVLLLARSAPHAALSTSMVSSPPHPSTIEIGTSTIKMNKTGMYEENNDQDNTDGYGYIESMGTKGVLDKYKSQIDAIYDFYTTSNIDVFHPALTMTHFSRLVKDCHLCGLSQGNSAELLWMTVMRSLNVKHGKRLAETQTRKQGIVLGNNMINEEKRKLFACQRLETIPKHLFGEALSILAREKRCKKQESDGIVVTGSNANSLLLDEKPEETLLTFLLYHVFPYVDAVMKEKQVSKDTRGFSAANCTLGITETSILENGFSIEDYKSGAVKGIVKEFMGRIKEGYTLAVKTAQGYQSTLMNLDGFVELARKYELLPLIRKAELRRIFLSCSAVEREKHPDAEEGTISVGSFLLALYHLADCIYGAAPTCKMFPTPESRIQKLLAKMFILN